MKVDKVNIEVGTASIYRESNGNTLPHVQYPLGNQSYVLETDRANGGWFYNPHVNYAEGIRISSQPSPWLGDHGQISLMPFSGEYTVDLHSSITKQQLSPVNLEIFFHRFATTFNLVPTKRGAEMIIKNQSNETTKLLIDCFTGNSSYYVEENTLYLTVSTIANSENSEHFRKFYALHFSEPFQINNVFCNNQKTVTKEGSDLKLILEFNTSSYHVIVASSYISLEQLQLNLYNEQQTNFVTKLNLVTEAWEKLLNTIEITDDITDQNLFYSNLYRVYCYPRFIHELNSENKPIFYDFISQSTKPGVMISDVGFWDTYRTTMPLMRMLTPDIYRKIIKAILNHYQATGWLARWLAPYERGIMPSTLTDVVISEAYLFGFIESEDRELAITALLNNGDTISSNQLYGRKCLSEYIQYGYVPADISNESVSMTLDNLLADYAISQVLKAAEHPDFCRYQTRYKNYEKIFNQQTNFFAPKTTEGSFQADFDPDLWGNDFCESSGWQNNFNLVYDVQGLINLFGSKAACCQRLDEIFDESAKFKVGKYQQEIHEMTEMIKCHDLGYFAISNQPSFVLPFWYLHLGEFEKFQQVITKTLKYFTVESDGYPGDEDNGSLSAWYIWVMLGKYPFNPLEKPIEFPSQCEYKINKYEE